MSTGLREKTSVGSRHQDWLKQAKRDLAHARDSLKGGYFEWSCFAAQQAAEKAVKAVYQKIGAEAWGHSVSELLGELPNKMKVGRPLLEFAKELDKYYIPARYPNAYPVGAPYEFYTKREAERAIKNAQKIIAFCEDQIS